MALPPLPNTLGASALSPSDILGSFANYNAVTGAPLPGSMGFGGFGSSGYGNANPYPGLPQGVDPNIAPKSVTVFTGPPPDYQSLIQNDPTYLQQLQYLKQGNDFQNQGFNLAQQRIDQSGQVSGAGLAAAQRNAQLQTQQAEHQHQLNLPALREALAARGMIDSGQNAFNVGEENFNYQKTVEGIQANLQAAQAAYQEASAQAANARSLAEAELALQKAQAAAQYGQQQSQLLFDTTGRLAQSGIGQPAMEAFWVGDRGAYQTLDGNWYDVNGKPIPAPPLMPGAASTGSFTNPGIAPPAAPSPPAAPPTPNPPAPPPSTGGPGRFLIPA